MDREVVRRREFLFISGRVGVMSKPHRHREVEVNLVTSGELVYQFGSRRVTLPAGQIAVFWATIPHATAHVAEGTGYYCIHLPLVRFLQWQLSGEFTSRLLHGQVVLEEDRARWERDIAVFTQWSHDLDSSAPDVNQVVLLELEARLRRLAWSAARERVATDPTVGAHPSEQSPDWVDQMALFITKNFRERITMQEIAAAVHLHPKYATTLFRDRCGMTPTEYLTQQRLSEAQRLLVTTDLKTVEIAFESGFGSVSQFYDVFTRFCDQAPNEFRAAQRW